ncbi:MAG: hypothetical protein GY915_07485, partial [bacterium]|nr:hypothetical protein [bacterium]
KLFQKRDLLKTLQEIDPLFNEKKLLFSEHHMSHAASAFYPSPFEEAVILTMDGVGEWATSSFCVGKGAQLKIVKEMKFPHSLGLLYSAFTYYAGFRVNSGEYKLMGLAPYGRPEYVDTIYDHLIDVKSDGSFWLDQSYFSYCTGLKMVNRKFETLFNHPTRKPEEEILQFHMDIAASIQKVTEEIVLKIANSLAKETGLKNLCLAGGVALNCVSNGRLLRESAFENIWTQPAAGDAGGALGAALAAYHLHFKKKRIPLKKGQLDQMKGSYLGPEFSTEEVAKRLKSAGAVFRTLSNEEPPLVAAKLLAEGKALGWMRGRMEFGPRALGGRSILADPRSEKMQKTLNLKVKYRESFRPFAPSVLAEKVSDWFCLDKESPYMLLVSGVAEHRRKNTTKEEESLFGIEKLSVPRSDIPAVTHVDYSARVQTVHKETNPSYHKLLTAFERETGCPVLVNTSFNVRGEPIVGTPEDAFRCFMGTELDVLVVENCLLLKVEQDQALCEDYKEKFAKD